MTDNLIFLLNKLSYEIVTREIEKEKDVKRDEAYLNKCVARVRRKGCDVLLNKTTEPPPPDPCITDYGGNWSPITLLLEFGRELRDMGALKYNDLLQSSVKTLEEHQFDHLNELLKLLLILKGPLMDSSKQQQPDVSFCGSEYLCRSTDTFSQLSGEFESSSRASFKRALQYEESWTNSFDTKFKVLGECSKMSLVVPDKVSLDSIFTASSINKNQSQSNSFVFTDLCIEKSYKSEKNLFHCSNTCLLDDISLLDSFIETPIAQKLPKLRLSQKGLSKSGFLDRSSEEMSRPLHYLVEEENLSTAGETRNQCSDGVINAKGVFSKSSGIQLKRNSNFGHSFSSTYQPNTRQKASSSRRSDGSNYSLLEIKQCNRVSSNKSSSKEIILALWEQERDMIVEYMPELAENFPTIRMISLRDFVRDVKYLLTGISSDTFKYNAETKKFVMEYGTCLDNVTPESLLDFSSEFLDIGNCYVWLNNSATEIGKSNLDTCPTLSQVFWKSIFEILQLHYSVILEIPSSIGLMALKASMKDLHEMMNKLLEVSKVSKSTESLPQGGKLVSYLLQVAEEVNRKCIINIIFGILLNCCNYYFMRILQTWMFKGQLDKKSNEFFIDCRRQKMKTNSRNYYDCFYIIDEYVPSFLRGYEESIFNCGKSVHFLKLFNPEDKFCRYLEKLESPNMRFCLSDTELEELEREFKEYENKVIELCGESISIKSMYEEEKEKERCYQEYIRECKKKQEEERQIALLKEHEDLKAKQEMQNELLNQQMSLIEAEKERKKREEEEQEKRLLEKLKAEQLKKEELIESEKGLIKNYYDELLSTLEKQLTLAEGRKETLKKMLSKSMDEEERILDIINDNTAVDKGTKETDSMQEEFDINDNSSTTITEDLVRVVNNSKFDLITDESIRRNSSGSILCDENSNPSISDEPLLMSAVETKPHRTLAAAEAEKNKVKILRSEFGMVTKGDQPEENKQKVRNVSSTELERNKRRVLESEFDIVKRESEHIYLRDDPLPAKMIKSKETNPLLPNAKSECIREAAFEMVELKRIEKCLDFEKPQITECLSLRKESSGSITTPIITDPSEVSFSNISEIINQTSSSSSSKIVNENYKNSLARDREMFRDKRFDWDIFGYSKTIECQKFHRMDLMKFKRYLRKSVLIPLRTQEKLANDALLKHLLKGENLLSHLESLRGYFFLNDGEFGRSFTQNTFRSLAKCTEPQQFFERSNLSNIVNEALNYTIHNCEPNAQNLSFQIVQMPPFLNHSSHDVLSPFELSYRVEWPLNLILTEKALNKYKKVFRFLLKLKRINWTLNENFLYLNSQFKKKNVERNALVRSSHYHKIQIYRHAMTQIMITLEDYIFSDGIQFPWIYFLKDLETTENIDHLYQKHVRYIKDVLTRCFLSDCSEDLLGYIHNLIELALKFHYTAKSSTMEVLQGRYVHPKFQVLKATFNEFCLVIKTCLKTLREKISFNEILKSHYVLVEKFDLILS